MSFPAYPEYNQSGLDWLGEVPSEWNVTPLKWQLLSNDGGVWGEEPTGDCDTIVLRSTEQTIEGAWNIVDPATRRLSDKETREAKLEEGDLLITKSSGSSLHIGKTSLVTSDVSELNCCFGNFIQRIRTRKTLLPKFAWYYLNNPVGRRQLNVLSNSTTGLANLNGSLIGEISVAVPPRDQQERIVTFLDQETARLDALIEEQQRMIALLAEKRQSVLSRAVTQGLNANAVTKKTVFEWLGKIPAHWDVGKLGHYATLQSGFALGNFEPTDDSVSVPYLRVANVQDGTIDLTDVKYVDVSESVISRYSLRKGDVLMNEGGDNNKLGRGSVWNAEIAPCLHQNHVFSVRSDKRLLPEWLSLFTKSRSGRVYFYLFSKQSTNLASISSTNIMNCPLPIPPVDEQRQILNQLEADLDHLDISEERSRELIELLHERRQALISAGVTGKIDVRESRTRSSEVSADWPMVAEKETPYG